MPETKARGPPTSALSHDSRAPAPTPYTPGAGAPNSEERRDRVIIELQRAHTPEDYGGKEVCGICAEWFTVEVVLASLLTERREDMDLACPSCVEVLGEYKPEKFPTIREYREARARWEGPIWAGTEEASAAWEEGEPHRAAIEANTIARA